MLCSNINEEGAKMITIKQYLLALKFRWILKFFTILFTIHCCLKNMCLKSNLFLTIFWSNCRINNIIRKLLFLRFFKTMMLNR